MQIPKSRKYIALNSPGQVDGKIRVSHVDVLNSVTFDDFKILWNWKHSEKVNNSSSSATAKSLITSSWCETNFLCCGKLIIRIPILWNKLMY